MAVPSIRTHAWQATGSLTFCVLHHSPDASYRPEMNGSKRPLDFRVEDEAS